MTRYLNYHAVETIVDEGSMLFVKGNGGVTNQALSEAGLSEAGVPRVVDFSFRFGGLIALFHCSIPVQGSQDNITSEKL